MTNINLFDIEKIQEDAPNSPCDIYNCDNPHEEELVVSIEDKTGSVRLCEDCLHKHITNALVYFLFIDENNLDIKIVYFQHEEDLDHHDTSWEYVCEHFFHDLFRYIKSPEGGLL